MKIQFSSGLQTSANMHTNTPNTKRTQCYNMQLCVGDPIKKKEVTAHIVRQADRQTGREREREGDRARQRLCCNGTFVAQTFVDLCNKTVA